jgi:hypothetical protein
MLFCKLQGEGHNKLCIIVQNPKDMQAHKHGNINMGNMRSSSDVLKEFGKIFYLSRERIEKS